MRIKRKEGVRGIRIVEHNKTVLYWIIGLVLLLVIVVCLLIYLNNQPKLIGGDKDSHGCLTGAGYSWCEEKQKCLRIWEETCGDSCYRDSDCVRASCCHASSCVIKTKEPNCEGVFCTAQCVHGTLDCKQASCGCVEGKCSLVAGNLTLRG